MFGNHLLSEWHFYVIVSSLSPTMSSTCYYAAKLFLFQIISILTKTAILGVLIHPVALLVFGFCLYHAFLHSFIMNIDKELVKTVQEYSSHMAKLSCIFLFKYMALEVISLSLTICTICLLSYM